jgi:hypothetical protein
MSVSDCCLMSIEQFFSNIMARTSYVCTSSPTHLVVFLIVLAHCRDRVRVMVFKFWEQENQRV